MPPAISDPVCIIGATGSLGVGLTLRLAAAGVPVVIGSRSPARAQQAAEDARKIVPAGNFTAAENSEAVKQAAVLIVAVPFASQAETLVGLRDALRPGHLLIDATVPLAVATGGRATRMLGVWQGSAAQQARELAPEGVNVVAALHTVSAAALCDLEQELAEDVLICGDSRKPKAQAAAVIEAIGGLRCIDCGRLEMARVAESLTALLISVNARHKTHAGIRLVRVPDERWENG